MSSVLNGKRENILFFPFAPSFCFCHLIHIHVCHEANLRNMQVGNKMKKH